MPRVLIATGLLALGWAAQCTSSHAADPLSVSSDFEGGSICVLEIDQPTRTIHCMPGGKPQRGWPCWWYFRVDGITPGETITLHLRGSTATNERPGGPAPKPLAPAWAMPTRATFSTDGTFWQQTNEGERGGEWMTYRLRPDRASVLVAWGPPFTPENAGQMVHQMASRSPHAASLELCRSREGRPVPMLRVAAGDRCNQQRFGVWVQARQHAWECGSSWVAQGFAEWLLSEDADAAWLRQHAELFIVPIMDVDNTATGNGGKDAVPHDHNRDWSSMPHWNETIAAQRLVTGLIHDGRMDVFLDLHNPAPDDPSFFYILPPDLLQEPMIGLRDRFIELAYLRISKSQPRIPISSKTKQTGASYHPLWQQISANWVSMHGNPQTVGLCLETGWNFKGSTTEGYRAVGASLAAAVKDYLSERPAHP